MFNTPFYIVVAILGTIALISGLADEYNRTGSIKGFFIEEVEIEMEVEEDEEAE